DEKHERRERPVHPDPRTESCGPDGLEHGRCQEGRPRAVDGRGTARGHDSTLSPTTHATRPAMSATRTIEARSWPLAIAHTAVSAAPMPTHTAYAVPVGMNRIAQPSPTIETTIATKNPAVGPRRFRPSDRASAVAQTAASAPLRMRTSHAMTGLPGQSCQVRVLIRRPGPRSSRAPPLLLSRPPREDHCRG